MLPSEFPNWKTCHYYFTEWRNSTDEEGVSVLDRSLKNWLERSEKNRAEVLDEFLIVDAQSVKNTDTAEEKGYDAGKKGIRNKRHIAVDTQGLPHALSVTTANVSDREGRFLCSMLVQKNSSILGKILFLTEAIEEKSSQKNSRNLLCCSRSCQKMNCIPLPLSQKDGSLNVLSPG